MRRLKNSVQLLGRLLGPPTLSWLSDGTAVANMMLALDEGFGVENGGGANAFPLVAHGKLAEDLTRRGESGSRFLIRGLLRNRILTKGGIRYCRTEIIVREFLSMGKVKEVADHAPR